MEKTLRSPWIIPALSGLLFSFGYSHSFLLPNLLGLVPMLWWVDVNRDRGVRFRFGGGLVFGCALWVSTLRWVLAILEITPMAWLMYGGLILVFAPCNATSWALAGWIRRSTRRSFALILPLAWLPLEWIHSFGDLRMTADHVSHSMSKFPFLIQFADLAGPYGVGLALLLVNALVYEVLALSERSEPKGRPWLHPALALLLLLAGVIAYDAWAWRHHATHSRTLRAAVVQPNVPFTVKWADETEQIQYGVLYRLTMAVDGRDVDLVVWPESSYPETIYHWEDVPQTYQASVPQTLAKALGTTILFGTEYARVRSTDDFDAYNAALVAHPDGTLDPEWTAKVYLVPFAETIPFEPVLGPILEDGEGEMRWMAGGFAPGPAAAVLDAAGARIGVTVCYEELFWDLTRDLRNAGADLQVIVTNDAWWGRTFFQYYLADVLRMRAIETRTSFVRAANTGVSGFVDPRGRYLEQSDLFVEAMLVADVPLAERSTLYGRIGDVVIWIANAGLIALMVYAGLRGREDQLRGVGLGREEDRLL